jgi:pimeloyl-ACP methyl ester carboxylesterase
MNTVSCNGISINYRRVGDGRDVVLIHGLGANYAFWHFDVLLPLARDYRVTVYDLRGHGHSGMPSSGYTSADMAEDLDHLLNHLDIPKAHLVGHSFGGVVALHCALLHPERVSSLTIADSRIRALQPTQRPRDWPNWKTAKKRLEKLGLFLPEDETESGLWLLEQLASPDWQQKRHRLRGSPLFIPFSRWGGGNRSAERWLELLDTTTAKQDLTSPAGLTLNELSKITHPTLAIYGEKSTVLPSLCGLREHLPDCKTVVVPGAGHFLPLTRPEFFVTTVSQFLKELEKVKICGNLWSRGL